jgi:hypothetical protein
MPACCIARKVRALVAAVLLATFGATAPAAADGALGGVEARRAALFAETLQDPTNLDVAFEYAMLSAQVGDYEAAIAALERMLVFAPDLPRVQLELGVLYYRIGATDTARAYFEAARRPDVPPEVRARVDAYMAAIERQDRRFLIDGQFTIGGQYQSNANAAPGGNTIIVNGIPLVLDENARAKADFNVFSLVALHFSYDLRNQGDLIEADFVTYNNAYFTEDQLNLDLAELSVGPSFSLGRIGIDRGRLGVYGILGGVALDREGYSTTYGAGVRLTAQLGDRLATDNRAEIRAVNYLDSEAYPTVRDQTGQEYRGYSELTYLIDPQTRVAIAAQGRVVDARVGYNSFGEVGPIARASHLFDGPKGGILADDRPWQVSLSGGALGRWYFDPDPLINVTEAERDRVFWAELGLAVPFRHDINAFLTGQIIDQWSNYDTRDYTNAILTFGLTKRF